ncbi:hypothetical protein LINPERPRIM_LOCUS12408 [Linum perenne]
MIIRRTSMLWITARFRGLRDRDWILVILHTYREGNRAADFLANIGYEL